MDGWSGFQCTTCGGQLWAAIEPEDGYVVQFVDSIAGATQYNSGKLKDFSKVESKLVACKVSCLKATRLFPKILTIHDVVIRKDLIEKRGTSGLAREHRYFRPTY